MRNNSYKPSNGGWEWLLWSTLHLIMYGAELVLFSEAATYSACSTGCYGSEKTAAAQGEGGGDSEQKDMKTISLQYWITVNVVIPGVYSSGKVERGNRKDGGK